MFKVALLIELLLVIWAFVSGGAGRATIVTGIVALLGWLLLGLYMAADGIAPYPRDPLMRRAFALHLLVSVLAFVSYWVRAW